MRLPRPWFSLALLLVASAAACQDIRVDSRSSADVTVTGPSPTPTTPRPGNSPSLTVSYQLRSGEGSTILETSSTGNFGTTLQTGRNYKVYLLASHGGIPGRVLDMSIVPGFNSDRPLAQLVNESGSPTTVTLGYGFTARSGDLPILTRVIEKSAGPEDMTNDFAVERTVVLRSH